MGRFFFPFGITVAFAVLVSLFVSFTLDPMLSSLWYDPQAEGGAKRGPIGRALERFNNSFHALGQRYRQVIAWSLNHRLATLGLAAAAFVGAMSLFGLGLVGGQFMPNSDNEQTALMLETPVGSSVAYTADKTLEIARYLDAQPEVELTYTTVGGAQQNNSVNKGQIYVKLVPKAARQRNQQEFEANLRTVLPKFHGIVGRVSQIDAGGSQSGADPAQPRGPRAVAPAGDLGPRSGADPERAGPGRSHVQPRGPQA